RAAPLREARRRTGAPAAACRPAHPPGLAVTAVRLFGVDFQNPVLLASGTAGFGREVEGVIDLDTLGGIVTKAVTLEPRRGHAAPPRPSRFRSSSRRCCPTSWQWRASRRTRAPMP